jgi:hypothetical protein
MEIIYAAIAIFGMTAIFGMYLLSLILRTKATPKGVTIIHGVMAVIAVVLLIIYCFMHQPGPWVSIIVFLLAASGGFILNYRDITGKSVPKWLGVIHGLTAITGFALLIGFVCCHANL